MSLYQRTKKSISKLEQIKQKCNESIESEIYFMPEEMKNILKEVYFNRIINKMMFN